MEIFKDVPTVKVMELSFSKSICRVCSFRCNRLVQFVRVGETILIKTALYVEDKKLFQKLKLLKLIFQEEFTTAKKSFSKGKET